VSTHLHLHYPFPIGYSVIEGSMHLTRIRTKKSYFFLSYLYSYPSPAQIPKTLRCTRVVDGDTIILSNGERVRLIGVDTPETKHPRKAVEYYGKEATAFTKRMVEGKEVRH